MFGRFINFLRLFKNISKEDASLIEQHLIFRQVKKDEELFAEGYICREMFFICRGVLRIVSQNEKGEMITYFFLKENQFCSVLNSFNNEVVANEGIEAACDAEVIVLKKQKLLELYQKLPYLKELITGITTQSLLDKIQLKNAYQGEDAATRYRHFMLRQADIALRVPLRDIASYLGITQQSLSRIRKNR